MVRTYLKMLHALKVEVALVDGLVGGWWGLIDISTGDETFKRVFQRRNSSGVADWSNGSGNS